MRILSMFRGPTGSPAKLKLSFVKRGPSWLRDELPRAFASPLPDCPTVEARAVEAERAGELPLWDGYKTVADYPRTTTGMRRSDQVRTNSETGKFFAWLAAQRAPEIIVEFGTAFGVSGMFWLTGLERAGGGLLMTYEPNLDWAEVARGNLAAISNRFVLVTGTFEQNAASTLHPHSVDLAFIDAIHTEEFVMKQFAILRPFMRDGGIILFDDIDFSDSMRKCWKEISNLPEAVASATINLRVGLVEL